MKKVFFLNIVFLYITLVFTLRMEDFTYDVFFLIFHYIGSRNV